MSSKQVPKSLPCKFALDLAKNKLHLLGKDANGVTFINKSITRENLIELALEQDSATFFMEACSSSHYWGRVFEEIGHEAKLIDPHRVKPFLTNKNKTDANDAEAIFLCGTNPDTRFVPVKSEEQQSYAHLVSARDRAMANRTQVINQTRGFLFEHGHIFPQGADQFVKSLLEFVVDKQDNLGEVFFFVLKENFNEIRQLEERIKRFDALIEKLSQDDEACQRLREVPGIGPTIAFTLSALLGDCSQYSNSRQVSAHCGLTPREFSSGGKRKLGGIRKAGNKTVRRCLVLAARVRLIGIQRRSKNPDGSYCTPLTYREQWALDLCENKGFGRAAVALANRMGRIVWAILSKGVRYDDTKKPHPKKAA
jgi:transposase